jgi:hypothetical protein
LTEAAAAHGKSKPMVAVNGTGVADDRAGKYFDRRKTTKVFGTVNAQRVVAVAFRYMKRGAHL